jgi:aspartyl-tRNA(Asn)/glutamyl-tRNA(Gln) amidotransferase subunit B
MTDLLRELNLAEKTIKDSPIKPEYLGKMIKLIDQGIISGKIGKSVFLDMWKEQRDPEEIIKSKGLVQISDTSAVEKLIDEVLLVSQAQVADYRSGRTKLFGFFVGQVMKLSKGQANPDLVNKILLEKLQG